MEEIQNNHLGCIPNLVNNRISTTNLNWLAGTISTTSDGTLVRFSFSPQVFHTVAARLRSTTYLPYLLRISGIVPKKSYDMGNPTLGRGLDFFRVQ